MDYMPLQWVLEHQPTLITALMFVMMDLTNEVSFYLDVKSLGHIIVQCLLFLEEGNHYAKIISLLQTLQNWQSGLKTCDKNHYATSQRNFYMAFSFFISMKTYDTYYKLVFA